MHKIVQVINQHFGKLLLINVAILAVLQTHFEFALTMVTNGFKFISGNLITILTLSHRLIAISNENVKPLRIGIVCVSVCNHV